MSSRPLLSGIQEYVQDETPALRSEIERLVDELRQERSKNAGIENGIRDLRRILSPLYDGLRLIFGEMDAMRVESSPVAGNSKWEAIKARYQGRIAEAIDVLLLHGTMNSSQLAAAMKMDRSNLSKNLLPKLSSMGLITRNGRDISLRER